MFLDSRRIELNRIREEEPPVRREIIQTTGARFQQLEHRKEPCMSLVDIALVPEAGRFKDRLEPDGKLVGCQPGDVLLTEPLQFFRIEHRITAADSFQPESGGELISTEKELTVAPGRPAEQREKVDHRLGQVSLPRVLHDG